MAELSIIIPFVNEYPQIVFTIRAIAEEFLGRSEFEILAINNFCEEFTKQGRVNDGGEAALRAAATVNPWLRVLTYQDRASHWQAKNLGIKEASSDFLMFLDGHIIPSRDSLYPMFRYYRDNYKELNGSIHLPLTYHILEYHKLIYKTDVNLELGKMEYTFDNFRESDEPYKTSVMSSCGMLVHRDILAALGNWPTALGSWGGGENFLNYALATTGRNVWIWPKGTLFHHGDKRGYAMSRTDVVYNRCLAVYLICGYKTAQKYLANAYKPSPTQTEIWQERTLLDIVHKCSEHRELIQDQQSITIEDWLTKW